MNKTIKRTLFICLLAIACLLFSVSAIGIANTAKANEVTPTLSSKPVLASGASIRKGDMKGIRFTVGVEQKDETSKYGILIARETYRDGAELIVENVGDEIKQVETLVWGVAQDIDGVNYTDVYHHVIYDIPDTDYNTQLAVRAYRTSNTGETEYSDVTAIRSAAEVAADLIKNGDEDEDLYTYVDGALNGVEWGFTLDGDWMTLSGSNGWVKNINVNGLEDNLKDKVVITSSNTSVIEIVYEGMQPQYKVVGAGDAEVIVKLGNAESRKSVHIAEAALYQDIDTRSSAWKFGNIGINWQDNAALSVAYDNNMSFDLYSTNNYDETLKQYYVANDQGHKVVSAGIGNNTVDWYSEWDGGMSHTFTASGKIRMELRLTMQAQKDLRIAVVPNGERVANRTEFVSCPANEAVSRDIEYDINVGDTIYLFFTGAGGGGTISLVFNKIG